jgi:hypothetical protein
LGVLKENATIAPNISGAITILQPPTPGLYTIPVPHNLRQRARGIRQYTVHTGACS